MASWFLNLVVPGAGLIILRREWVGFLLAILFGVCANTAAAGLLIAPEAMPGWVPWTALGMSILTWLLAQVLLRRQVKYQRACAARIASLLDASRNAIAAGDIAGARALLRTAASLDEDDVEVNVLQAELLPADERGP